MQKFHECRWQWNIHNHESLDTLLQSYQLGLAPLMKAFIAANMNAHFLPLWAKSRSQNVKKWTFKAHNIFGHFILPLTISSPPYYGPCEHNQRGLSFWLQDSRSNLTNINQTMRCWRIAVPNLLYQEMWVSIGSTTPVVKRFKSWESLVWALIYYTVYCILYTVYCILYTVYCILYTVYIQ